jgi:hypothetical protein
MSIMRRWRRRDTQLVRCAYCLVNCPSLLLFAPVQTPSICSPFVHRSFSAEPEMFYIPRPLFMALLAFFREIDFFWVSSFVSLLLLFVILIVFSLLLSFRLISRLVLFTPVIYNNFNASTVKEGLIERWDFERLSNRIECLAQLLFGCTRAVLAQRRVSE